MAIVTGGASGIGGAVSRSFIRRGAKVVAVDLDGDAGAALVEEFGDDVAFLTGDVSDPTVPSLAVTVAEDRFGRLDALINNAHASRQASFRETTQEMWDLSFNTGLWATRNFMMAAYEELRKTRGSVVNFASGAGLSGNENQVSYADAYAASAALIPLGRFGDPETDVAPIVAFLASDDSRYMTGQTLMADGGAIKLR